MASTSKTPVKPCVNVSQKVRVVARVRGFKDQELASSSMIHVRKFRESSEASDNVTISFDDPTSSRKNEYAVDCCYWQSEETAVIFKKEIKPRISSAFDGENSTFIAFGARGSGKTYTIQGSEENLGLGMLAMDEILKVVEGGRYRVEVSIYEVFQNHVYDLLDSKNREVRVLEDAQGKVILKGLSKLHVKSNTEFQKLYCGGSSSNKGTQKIPLELPRRSHKALMIHILDCEEGENPKCVGKLNFVDLAGYENPRRNSIDGTNFVEGTQITKSLNGLLNVIYAVNVNESRVPYRESKLARVLQDSLSGNSHISMLVCLNPLFCPDTIQAVILASRLRNIKPVAITSSAMKNTNSRVPLSTKKTNTSVGVCSTIKIQTNSRLPMSAKKTNGVIKGRKLFCGTETTKGKKEQVLSKANNVSNIAKTDISIGDSTDVPCVEGKCSSNEASFSSDVIEVTASVSEPPDEEKCSSKEASFSSDTVDVTASVSQPPNEEILESDASQEMKSLVMLLEDASLKTQNNYTELVPHVNDDSIDKENNRLLLNEGQSPPVSDQLKKISEKMKLTFNSPTPVCMSRPQDANTEVGKWVDIVEPETPIVTQDANIEVGKCVDTLEPETPTVTRKMDFSNCKSGTFSKRSSGMKHSLVQDYLQFLNSATKDDLKKIRGIGEKRAGYILELREESPEPFKSLDDLQDIGLSAKQVKSMMKNVVGDLFS